MRGKLVNEGTAEWRHMSEKLCKHEVRKAHILHMLDWAEMRIRMEKNETIDKHAQARINSEKAHWKEVLQMS